MNFVLKKNWANFSWNVACPHKIRALRKEDELQSAPSVFRGAQESSDKGSIKMCNQIQNITFSEQKKTDLIREPGPPLLCVFCIVVSGSLAVLHFLMSSFSFAKNVSLSRCFTASVCLSFDS